MIELFQITTVSPVLPGVVDAVVCWIVCDRQEPPAPYVEAIADYDPSDRVMDSAKAYVDGLFTTDEARRFVAWLGKLKNGATKISRVELPIAKGFMGFFPHGRPDSTAFFPAPRNMTCRSKWPALAIRAPPTDVENVQVGHWPLRKRPFARAEWTPFMVVRRGDELEGRNRGASRRHARPTRSAAQACV